ncbi:hypothetical protein PsYK624_164900 [Phanerochaete sordida]|uniref:Tc1-like transposase DDE domain-containing protein n=1 Tax=Phanerochaete sordida TaxID=48140 RepID=A0A9P3LN29_9APHY|nr:hypothetical protein PsYK624_164900 [Phanerochaete sordida]
MREASAAHDDITNLLRPRRRNGIGHLHFTKGDDLQRKLEQMRMFLYQYTQGVSTWTAASLQIARMWEEGETGEYHARQLRQWTRSFIADRHALPVSRMGTWNQSLIDKKPELKQAINLHLQSVGKYVRAMDIVDFLADPLVQLEHGLGEGISLSTAQVWMHKLDYRWTRASKGLFVDGHERGDVTTYRNDIFLPTLEVVHPRLRLWSKDGTEIAVSGALPVGSPQRRVVLWYHDESTFYAHDRRHVYWQKSGGTKEPQPKGEGASLMVADFVSADHGWLASPDGKESARVFFKVGKNREGYWDNDDVLAQASKAMDILQRHYPHEDHILIYDNAPIHKKRSPESLSALHMSMGPTKKPGYFFGVEIPVKHPVTKKPVYEPDGTIAKEKVPMTGARLPDGTPQSLYFPEGHPQARVFKGMTIVLAERGIDVSKLPAQCKGKGFNCAPPAIDCCCRRVMYNQPDFQEARSLLETHCEARGFQVLFLPKFHCELNPIEQCWGMAKREYRMYPESSSEAVLEINVAKALATVDLYSMRRFFTRTLRFMDGYRYGLTGKAAAYAVKRYSGHRVLPGLQVLEELELAGQLEMVER